MKPALPVTATRCGIDTVELERIERLVDGASEDTLRALFSAQELADSAGGSRIAHLAARFAAKEACAKLFPRELALGSVVLEDFAIARDAYGAPRVVMTPKVADLCARHGLAGIEVSLTHDGTRASAVALAVSAQVAPAPDVASGALDAVR